MHCVTPFTALNPGAKHIIGITDINQTFSSDAPRAMKAILLSTAYFDHASGAANSLHVMPSSPSSAPSEVSLSRGCEMWMGGKRADVAMQTSSHWQRSDTSLIVIVGETVQVALRLSDNYEKWKQEPGLSRGYSCQTAEMELRLF